MVPTSTSAVICSMRRRASRPAAASTEAIFTVPSSLTSMVAPVSSVSDRMTLPPLPMTSRIFSGWILNEMIRGANTDMSARVAASVAFIRSRMWSLPSRACTRAVSMISRVIPSILMSICSAVTPSLVPATLKSMSPR